MAVKKQIVEFCNKTSMKGVPRAVKADTFYFKWLWILAVIGFCAVCIAQVGMLLDDFFSYPTTTNSFTAKLDFFKADILPSYTICSLRPAVHLSRSARHEYTGMLAEMTQCPNCNESVKRILGRLASTGGYFQYIGKEATGKIGIESSDMIIACTLILLHGRNTRMMPCHDQVNITKIVQPTFYNCYELRLPEPEYPQLLPIGISLDLFVENLDTSQYGVYDPTIEYTTSAGISFAINEIDTMPFTTQSHIIAAPGTQTDISYKVRRFHRLPAPYGSCESDIPTSVAFLTNNLKYSVASCSALCTTKGVREKCGCTHADSAYGFIEATEEYPYCENASLPLSKLIEYEQCFNIDSIKVLENCNQLCKIECHSIEYDLQVSTASWPLRSYHKAFYDQYIANGRLKPKFDQVLEKRQQYRNKSSDCDCNSDREKAELINSNFLKVTTRLANLDVEVMEDTVKYTTASLISQLGGLLNLWSGITVYLVIELVELSIRIGTTWLQCGEKKSITKIRSMEMEKTVPLSNQ